MRMHMGVDWRPMPMPPLLWLNTAVLVAELSTLLVAKLPATAPVGDAMRYRNVNGVYMIGSHHRRHQCNSFICFSNQLL